MNHKSPRVGIIVGSGSDWPVMQQAADVLDSFGVPYEAKVTSAHRSPDLARKYASTAAKRGIKVVIAGAGAAAHLAGVVAAHTVLPVLAVPVNATALQGLDALLASVQMPQGIPVGCLAIDGAANAALLAVSILATSDAALAAKLVEYRAGLRAKTVKASRELERKLNQTK